MDLVEARRLAVSLMAEHGLDGWSFAFDRAVRRAGSCRYDTRRITLSRALTELHSYDEVRDTILHEIAHALTPGEAHSAKWRAVALAIGGTGERCVPVEAARVPGAWIGTCPAGHTVERHRAPKRRASCSRCSRTFDPAYALTWARRA